MPLNQGIPVSDKKTQEGERDGSSWQEIELREKTSAALAKAQLAGQQEDEKSVAEIKFRRLLGANSPEWPYILVGLVASGVMGGVMPLFSLLFGDVTAILSYTDTAQARDESVFYALMFGLLGLGSLVAMFLQGLMFGISGK